MASQVEEKQLIMNAVLAGAKAQRLISDDKLIDAKELIEGLSSEVDSTTAAYLVGRIVDRN